MTQPKPISFRHDIVPRVEHKVRSRGLSHVSAVVETLEEMAREIHTDEEEQNGA